MIKAINFCSQIKPISTHNTQRAFSDPIQNDSFKKSDAQGTNEFIKWAKDSDFIPFGLAQTLSEENKIGGYFDLHKSYAKGFPPIAVIFGTILFRAAPFCINSWQFDCLSIYFFSRIRRKIGGNGVSVLFV